MTMIERVKAAIAEAMPPSRDLTEMGFVPDENLYEVARAAIEAMRIPTDEMRKAGADEFEVSGDDYLCAYLAMIDSALQTKTAPAGED